MSGNARSLDPTATLADLSRMLATEPLRFQPGTQWFYSWSSDICARLVEVIADEPFGDYVQRTILDPLGMADTGFSVPESEAAPGGVDVRPQRQGHGAGRRPAQEPAVSRAGDAVRRRRSRRHDRRLRPLLPGAHGGRGARRCAHPRPPDRRADAHQPPARTAASSATSPCPAATARSASTATGSACRSPSASVPPRPPASDRPATSCGAAPRRPRSGSTRPRTSTPCS